MVTTEGAVEFQLFVGQIGFLRIENPDPQRLPQLVGAAPGVRLTETVGSPAVGLLVLVAGRLNASPLQMSAMGVKLGVLCAFTLTVRSSVVAH